MNSRSFKLFHGYVVAKSSSVIAWLNFSQARSSLSRRGMGATMDGLDMLTPGWAGEVPALDLVVAQGDQEPR